MKKCDFCPESTIEGKCRQEQWFSLESDRKACCKKAIERMAEALNKQAKIDKNN